METSELRIGNLVRYKGGQPYNVESIGAHGINIEGGDGGLYWDEDEHLTGVEITPEILEKAGFEKEDDRFSREGEWLVLIYQVSDFGVAAKGAKGCLTFIKYVHQLQNIYFFMFGEELEINL